MVENSMKTKQMPKVMAEKLSLLTPKERKYFAVMWA